MRSLNVMKKNLAVFTTLTVAVVVLTGCACASTAKSTQPAAPTTAFVGQPPAILQQPETITAEAGTFVAFSVRVANAKHARYQWRVNDRNISKANKRELFIKRVTTKDVGAYSVLVTWPNGKIMSTNAFLSVYKLAGTNSTTGSLTTSAQQFLNYGGTGYVCSTRPALSFDRYYQPMDSAGNFYFFYGPDVPISSQSGPFINWGHCKKLVIDTFTYDTSSRPTALRFINAFYPTPSNLTSTDLGCEAYGVGGVGFTFNPLATGTDPLQARYRAVIYYQSPAPPSGNIILNWMYYDGSDIL
jgi:hypothetical protein